MELFHKLRISITKISVTTHYNTRRQISLVIADFKVKIYHFSTCFKLTDMSLIFNLKHQVSLGDMKKGLFHFDVAAKLTTLAR